MAEETIHGRKWYQFSLRTMLLMATAFSVILALFAWNLHETRKYTRLLYKLEHCHPEVEWSYGKPVALHMMDPLSNFNLTDEDLAVVSQISSLRDLRIQYAPNVTDNGIKHLCELKGLRTLMLQNTRLTDDGLKHLKQLPNLSGLDISGNNITDDGLLHLQDFKTLHNLFLAGTDITDEGILTLEKLPDIALIILGPPNPDLSKEALEKLRRDKPRWKVDIQDEYNLHLDSGKPHYSVSNPKNSSERGYDFGKSWILVSEITEPGIEALMICKVDLDLMKKLGLQPEDIKASGDQVLAALQSQLPSQAVDMFSAGMLSTEDNTTDEKARSIKKIINEGFWVVFIFGPHDGFISQDCLRTRVQNKNLLSPAILHKKGAKRENR